SVTTAFKTASPLIILVWGAITVLHGELSLGTMLGLNALALGFLTPLGNLVATLSKMQILGSYLERIDDVLSATREQDKPAAAHTGGRRGRTVLERVGFGYSPPRRLVVRAVSPPVGPGRSVALVGRAARASRPSPACCSACISRRRGASSTTGSTCSTS